MYFDDLKTESEIKSRYKYLAKRHHPDLGGCLEIMKEINNEYEKALTGMYQTSGKSITEIEELLKKDFKLAEKLNGIILLTDLIIEICGSWLWVTGNTREHKEKLKTLQFFWSQKKGAWYWRSEENKSYNRKSMTLDEIRQKHGSVSIASKKMQLVS